MCTPLPITPHHPRESPGSFVRGILVNLQFLECTMQLLQCRLLASGRFTSYTPNRLFEIPTISCLAPVFMLRECLYKCLFLSFSHLCTTYDVVRCVSNSHVIHCLNLCMFRAARFSSGGLGLWVFGEDFAGCEVWKGKVQVMVSLLRGKRKGRRSWVEERGKAFAIVKSQGEGESENQTNHFVLLPISSQRQACATSMPD